MDREMLIQFTMDYKSFKINTKYLLNGKLIIISGINGSGKSQLLESIMGNQTNVYINKCILSKKNIAMYSFRNNISLPTFGNYSYEIISAINNGIISFYNNMKYYYKVHNKDTFRDYCIQNLEIGISLKGNNFNQNINKKVSASSIAKIFDYIYDSTSEIWLNYTSEEVLNRIPNDFIIKFEGEEIEGITRIFTEAVRSRAKERDKFADLNEKFDNNKWLKNAPWTEINNLFEKMHFNYRFAEDFNYEIPNLKTPPVLYAFEKGVINKREIRQINDLSDGEKAILKLIIASYDRKGDDVTKLLLLDEYDATLNPSLIKNFYLVIKEYYLDRGITVIITTHSPVTIYLASEFSDCLTYYEIFRQDDASPKIKEVNTSEYQELGFVENYYNKIQNPTLRLKQLEQENNKLKEIIHNQTKPIVLTEGKTDWKHLKEAKIKLKNMDEYDFFEYECEMGDEELLKILKSYAKLYNAQKLIFIFDNDNPKISSQVSENGCNFKCWGNNVYSFVIPQPHIRENEDSISIEHYYPDEILKKEIKCEDGIIRRIYCGNDFQTTGLNNTIKKRCNRKNCCGIDIIRVLSGCEQEKVYDIDKEDDKSPNYALTKNDFFEKIIKDNNDIDMTKFNLILDIITEIINI